MAILLAVMQAFSFQVVQILTEEILSEALPHSPPQAIDKHQAAQEFATANCIEITNFSYELKRSDRNLVLKVPQQSSKAKGRILSGLF